MGLFFERQYVGDPLADAMVDALTQDPRTVSDAPAEARRRSAAARAVKAAAPVVPKTRNIVLGLVLTALLLAAAYLLATLVDPQLIAQADKAATTPGYKVPDLQLKQLSDALRAMLLAWSGGLVGAILGDGIGTATAK